MWRAPLFLISVVGAHFRNSHTPMNSSHSCSGILEELTVDDVRDLKPNLAIIPIGSTEAHGPALPYGTDTFQVREMVYGATPLANARGARAVCLPPLPISLNNNARAFPFACRLGVETFMRVLGDIVDQCLADGVRRIIFVNGHGGNPDVIHAVERDLAARDGLFVCSVNAYDMGAPDAVAVWSSPSDHAGEEETSYMLAIRPDLVRSEHLADFPQHQPKLQALSKYPVHFVRPWHRYLPVSAGGDATTASAEKGRAVLDSIITRLADLFTELSQAPDTEAFPY